MVLNNYSRIDIDNAVQQILLMRIDIPYGYDIKKMSVVNIKARQKRWSGRLDSNQRPLGPKPSALPNCATPRP